MKQLHQKAQKAQVILVLVLCVLVPSSILAAITHTPGALTWGAITCLFIVAYLTSLAAAQFTKPKE